MSIVLDKEEKDKGIKQTKMPLTDSKHLKGFMFV